MLGIRRRAYVALEICLGVEKPRYGERSSLLHWISADPSGTDLSILALNASVKSSARTYTGIGQDSGLASVSDRKAVASWVAYPASQAMTVGHWFSRFVGEFWSIRSISSGLVFLTGEGFNQPLTWRKKRYGSAPAKGERSGRFHPEPGRPMPASSKFRS